MLPSANAFNLDMHEILSFRKELKMLCSMYEEIRSNSPFIGLKTFCKSSF